MGCGASTEGGPRNDEPPIPPINVLEKEPKSPAPVPAPNGKNDIYTPQDYTALDNKVKQLSPRLNISTYENLIKTLTSGCTTDLQKLRSIFVWLFLQDIHGSFYSGVTDPNTPRGYMKLIKTQNGSYELFFAQLCRAADIPCNVIKGIAKGDKYEVGQQAVSELESAWCAVYVAGGWRFVHLLWAYFQEKQTYENGVPPSPGTKRANINEFFWLVDANKLICFCKPHVEQWQLLKVKWEHTKFLKSPLFTEEYFGCGLLLPKKYNAVITSDNGISTIEFDHHNYEEPALDTVVDFDDDVSSNDIPPDLDLNDYVTKASSSSRKTLIVRYPIRGRYKAVIFGGLDPSLPRIVEFRLDCRDIGRDPQPFPLNPPEGFGILPIASQFGISDPVPDSGIILVRPTQQRHFSFTTTQRLEVQASLTHRKHGSDMFSDFVSTRCADEEVHVAVSVPDETILEFGLQIAVRPEFASRNFTVIASYLLVDENWQKKTAVVVPSRVSKNEEDRVRKALIAASHKNSIPPLEKAIGEFEHHSLYDNGDLTRARHKLEQLHLQNLRKATLDRKIEELEVAINSAKKSHVAPELADSKELKEAEMTKLQLRRLKLYMHKVLALNKATISEMHSYQRPRPLVHQVMKATFRILGEPNSKIQEWPYVQTSMRQLGRNSMLNRMKRCDVVHMKQRQVEDAEGYLKDTNKNLVRMCSAGAGTFYVWSNNMISEYQGKGDIEPLAITSTTNKWDRGNKLTKKKVPPNDSVTASQNDTFPNQSYGDDSFRDEWDPAENSTNRKHDEPNNNLVDLSRYSDHWDPNAPSVQDRNTRR
ncbi:unnamed protein product [Candidula unifasciata]|uniref:Kyphoscoliosis peptidase n=1 Tax=Candidula unifasciata TaxID=100452 RepID=A0A8S3ZW96_9EUPU|nr:unnamed protein product [Candidula unifasciata]